MPTPEIIFKFFKIIIQNSKLLVNWFYQGAKNLTKCSPEATCK